MKPVRKVIRREEIEFFPRLHGLWEGIVTLPRPPPFDIETMEPIEPPWQAIKEWIPDEEPALDWFNRPRNPSDPDPTGSTKLRYGNPRKSIRTTPASWFSNPPDRQKPIHQKNRRHKKSWHSGPESYAHDK